MSLLSAVRFEQSTAAVSDVPTTRDLALRLHPQRGWRNLSRRLSLRLRWLRRPRLARAWHAVLLQPPLDWLAGRQPQLYSKPFEPYLNRRFDTQQRLHWLESHYAFLTHRLSRARFRELHATGLRLVEWRDEGAEGLQLWLGSDRRYARLGELVLKLRSERGGTLAALAFTILIRPDEPPALAIGALHGATAHAAMASIRSVSAQPHGLRPKALVIAGLQFLADTWGIGSLLAVSDAARVDEPVSRAAWSRRRPVVCDPLWQEFGGVPGYGGFYELPREPRLRDARGERPQSAVRRYRLFEVLRGTIQQTLSPR